MYYNIYYTLNAMTIHLLTRYFVCLVEILLVAACSCTVLLSWQHNKQFKVINACLCTPYYESAFTTVMYSKTV